MSGDSPGDGDAGLTPEAVLRAATRDKTAGKTPGRGRDDESQSAGSQPDERPNPFAYVAPVLPPFDPGGAGFEFPLVPETPCEAESDGQNTDNDPEEHA